VQPEEDGWYPMTHLVFGEQRVAYASHQHHTDEEREKGLGDHDCVGLEGSGCL
jgi:hypothetical protein